MRFDDICTLWFFLLYESIFSLNENKEKKIYNKNEKTQPS